MSAPDFPTLQTARLSLREITDADAPALLAIHGDAHTMRWFGADPLPDLAAAQALVQTFAAWRTQANPGVRWGLQARDDAAAGRDGASAGAADAVAPPGMLIGSCGLFGWNRGWRKCALGYELAAPAHGAGLMHEALCAAIPWGFESMALNRIEAQVHPDNAPSRRLLGRLGFVEEGRLRQVGFWGGRHHDLLMYSLLREDWPPAPAAMPPG